ncbi:anti-anti-sigma factor [Anaerohalosphaera lusitana]|uniref:Anti-anti-sigma factor n=1 Tax=Anaerohalosphaera lusitana TaxID=1936003 RepID=A0A1U9NKP9_9BACT|nr:STAS domain-containing protein [Anaerohalosphaera lusitana]AQT68385.1 anti-anti-sigma factor [Anaerohalosphaera lusitana]
MGIENWSDNVVVLDLAAEPDLGEELESAVSLAQKKGDVNVVVDFTDVDIITSSSIAKLLKLRKVLTDTGRQLIFTGVGSQTMSVFKVTALDSVFEFVDDKFVALASLQMAG